MAPHQPMTVTPSTNAEGDVVDFMVNQTAHAYQTSDNEFVTDSQGQNHHIFENVELNEDDVSWDVSEDIREGILVEYPSLSNAVAWATRHNVMSEEDVVAWNRAVDLRPEDGFGAIDALHQQAQSLIAMYEEHQGSNPLTGELDPEYESEDEEDAEEYDYSDEEFAEYMELDENGDIDNALDALLDESSLDENSISYMEHRLTNAETDIEADMMSLGLSVTRGDISIEEAIENFADMYGDVRAVNQFFKTQEHYLCQ